MADTSTRPPPSSSTSSTSSTRGKKKTPTWYYVAGVAGVAVVYYLYKKSKATTAASTAPAGSATAPVAAGSYGLAPYLQNPTPTTTPQAAYTAPTGETLQGGGFGVPTGYGTPGGPSTIVAANGAQYQPVSSLAQANAISGGGGSYQGLYVQVQPGVFMPAGPQDVNTPFFSLVQGPTQPSGG